ncbi:MAG: oligosaccharide flippase family protein [Clostridia bacterium]|nr:oligosaccharide flippase family protein [Clostridia bacterium]
MKKTLFVKNAAVLTATSLLLRFAGIIFKVWLAKRIGADGMGLYGLVFSLYAVAAAGTASGLPIAVTRLIAETGEGERQNGKAILSAAFGLNLVISTVIGGVLFFGAKFFAGRIIGDLRAALSIKVLAFSVVFMGIGAVIRGYFIARRNAYPGAISLVLEQGVRIGLVLVALRITKGAALGVTCAAVFLGDTAAEIISCLYLYLRYKADIRRLRPSPRRSKITGRLFSISLPITSGKYLNSILRAGENMLVPRALKRFSGKGALAIFGMIKGMALPVLLFPSVLLGAVSTLLVPEMSEAAGKRRILVVRAAVRDVISAALTVGFIFSAIFAAAGYKIGGLLYGNADVGFLLCAIAPIVPLMYVDGLCDGLLKGLNQQNFTFKISVFDSAARLALVFPVVSRFGVKGFIVIMYLSNLFTALLNVHRLIKISGAALNVQKSVLTPVLCAFCVTLLTKVILDFFLLSDLIYIILISAISIGVYGLLLVHFDCINFLSIGRMRTHKKCAAKTTAASLTK